MNKAVRTLKIVVETLWLIVALGCLFIAIRETLIHGIKPALKFYLFFGIGLYFFTTRRNQRLNGKNS